MSTTYPAAKVRQAAKDLGLRINTGFGMPVENNTISPDPAVRQKGVDLSKRLVDLS
jgi:D-psicose/D-tagatose/L-ribulose 3-epimerase